MNDLTTIDALPDDLIAHLQPLTAEERLEITVQLNDLHGRFQGLRPSKLDRHIADLESAEAGGDHVEGALIQARAARAYLEAVYS